jgi:hypothetical protein
VHVDVDYTADILKILIVFKALKLEVIRFFRMLRVQPTLSWCHCPKIRSRLICYNNSLCKIINYWLESNPLLGALGIFLITTCPE